MANATSVSWAGASRTGQPATQGMMQADGFFSPVTLGSPHDPTGGPSKGPAQFPYGIGSTVGPTAVVNTNTATTNTTLTAANITGGNPVTLLLTGTLGAGANAQLPTVAALITALGSGAVVGTSYTLTIVNASAGAFAWTVTTNAGSGTWTLTGTMSIAQNTTRTFVVTLTNVTAGTLAATITSVGTGTYS